MLKLQPTLQQDTPPTYNLSIPFFSHGTAKELFDLIENIQLICQGQNLMNGPVCYTLVRHLLQGDVLAAFNCGPMTCGNKTIQHFKLVLHNLITHVHPSHALQMQHWFMHCELCKPFKAPLQEFMT